MEEKVRQLDKMAELAVFPQERKLHWAWMAMVRSAKSPPARRAVIVFPAPMDCQPGVSLPSTEVSPTRRGVGKNCLRIVVRFRAACPGALLAAGFIFLAGKSLFQSLQAGSSTIPSQQIELNTASHVELMLLPGVGEQMARRIIKVRDEKGAFQKIDDLRKVPGLGPVTLERLRNWVVISANPSPPVKLDSVLPLTVEPSNRAGVKSNKAASLTEPIEVNTASREQLMATSRHRPQAFTEHHRSANPKALSDNRRPAPRSGYRRQNPGKNQAPSSPFIDRLTPFRRNGKECG